MSIDNTKYRIFKEILNNQAERYYPQVFDLDRNGWIFLNESPQGRIEPSSVRNQHVSNLVTAAQLIERYQHQRRQYWLEQVASSEYIELNNEFWSRFPDHKPIIINSLGSENESLQVKSA